MVGKAPKSGPSVRLNYVGQEGSRCSAESSGVRRSRRTVSLAVSTVSMMSILPQGWQADRISDDRGRSRQAVRSSFAGPESRKDGP
jgi:hypothetical protein